MHAPQLLFFRFFFQRQPTLLNFYILRKQFICAKQFQKVYPAKAIPSDNGSPISRSCTVF